MNVERQFRLLARAVARRHRENEQRFDAIEKTLANVAGQLKVALALLIANGVLNVYVSAAHK